MNTNLLGKAAPGFDQPLDLLEACHGRIEKQCATLEKLMTHLPQSVAVAAYDSARASGRSGSESFRAPAALQLRPTPCGYKETPVRYELKPVRNRMPENGCGIQVQQAARALLNYFDSAAVHHHDDEERNLFPLLEKAGKEEALDLCGLVELLTSEHDDLALLWRGLRPALQVLAEGLAAAPDHANAQRFIELNRSHLAFENEHLLPMARRVLSTADLERLGRAMAARRGVSYTR